MFRNKRKAKIQKYYFAVLLPNNSSKNIQLSACCPFLLLNRIVGHYGASYKACIIYRLLCLVHRLTLTSVMFGVIGNTNILLMGQLM
jgi:hypothetical protein